MVQIHMNTVVEVRCAFSKSLDMVTGGNFEGEYPSKRMLRSKISMSWCKNGHGLKSGRRAKNIGRIAMLYLATATMGPFGAAMMNVMYDKMVLRGTCQRRTC